MREAELAAEEVRPVRAVTVRLPEDIVRPVEGLHAGVAGAAGVRGDPAAVEQGQERLDLVPLRVVDRVPVVTTSAGGWPVAGPRTALTVRRVASTACGVIASCGRCTGTRPAYRGSAK